MELKSLLVASKTTWVEFPGLDGFEVELANLSRKELLALRKRCTEQKFNRKTRAFEETLNDEKFVKDFTDSTVKGWKGLKLKHLEDLLLVDISGQDADSLLDYSIDNAKQLVDNSGEFDNWLNEVVFDLDNFRTVSKGNDTGKTEEIPGS